MKSRKSRKIIKAVPKDSASGRCEIRVNILFSTVARRWLANSIMASFVRRGLPPWCFCACVVHNGLPIHSVVHGELADENLNCRHEFGCSSHFAPHNSHPKQEHHIFESSAPQLNCSSRISSFHWFNHSHHIRMMMCGTKKEKKIHCRCIFFLEKKYIVAG